MLVSAIAGVVSRPSKIAHYVKDKVKILKRTVFYRYARRISLTILVCLAMLVSALAQKPATQETTPKQIPKETPKETKPAAKLPFQLTVKTRPILNISLKAEKAKMSDVAQELSKRLKTPIFLGTERQNELLTIEFSELTLEPALQLLAPSVYVDYEIDTGSMMPPKPLGIFLYDANQGEPPMSAIVHGSTQTMLIEGNTEDGVESETEQDKKDAEEKPLRIVYQNGLLSVKAKKQLLSVVLVKIGEELGIPVDIQNADNEPINIEFSKLPVEDAVRQLSPNIRLFLRADLTRADKRALRLILAGPPKTVQQNPE